MAHVAEKQGDLATASQLLREGIPIAEEMREVATSEQLVTLAQRGLHLAIGDRESPAPITGVLE